MEVVKIAAAVLLMALAVVLASSQRCIDVIREAVFDLLVIIFITAAGVKLVEWATGQ